MEIKIWMSLEWMPGPTKSRASGETDKLCIESCSGVSIFNPDRRSHLVKQTANQIIYYTAIMRALARLMNTWNVILPMFVAEYIPGSTSPNFGGTGCDFPCNV